MYSFFVFDPCFVMQYLLSFLALKRQMEKLPDELMDNMKTVLTIANKVCGGI